MWVTDRILACGLAFDAGSKRRITGFTRIDRGRALRRNVGLVYFARPACNISFDLASCLVDAFHAKRVSEFAGQVMITESNDGPAQGKPPVYRRVSGIRVLNLGSGLSSSPARCDRVLRTQQRSDGLAYRHRGRGPA